MAEDENQNEGRISPINEIDLTFLTTDPAWGKQQVPKEYLKQIIRDKQIILAQIDEEGKIHIITDEKDKPIYYSEIEKMWSRLAFLTKDVRLGNLSSMGSDAVYCEYYLDLAGDLLEAGFPNAHISALQRAAVKLEVSQSKGGFLRKRQGTITSENIINELDPEKKRSFFGGQKQQ